MYVVSLVARKVNDSFCLLVLLSIKSSSINHCVIMARRKISDSGVAFLLAILASVLATIPADMSVDYRRVELCHDALVVPCRGVIRTNQPPPPPPSSTCCANLQKQWEACYCTLTKVPEGRVFITSSYVNKVLETCNVRPIHLHCLM